MKFLALLLVLSFGSVWAQDVNGSKLPLTSGEAEVLEKYLENSYGTIHQLTSSSVSIDGPEVILVRSKYFNESEVNLTMKAVLHNDVWLTAEDIAIDNVLSFAYDLANIDCQAAYEFMKDTYAQDIADGKVKMESQELLNSEGELKQVQVYLTYVENPTGLNCAERGEVPVKYCFADKFSRLDTLKIKFDGEPLEGDEIELYRVSLHQHLGKKRDKRFSIEGVELSSADKKLIAKQILNTRDYDYKRKKGLFGFINKKDVQGQTVKSDKVIIKRK
ncbi:MAG: hypothetical protein H6621_02405 [Halobacteriovoraceae bacterium]|nr:hypothetical protein [Halobacteriovoraceae bacterium]MCB9093894.1 hypothetical protein [Halobacteriovoraceae bacterium]